MAALSEAWDLFKGMTPANWKQENTLAVVNEKLGVNRADYCPKKQTEFQKSVTKQIVEKLKEVIDHETPFSPHYYYFKHLLPLGKIHGYQNACLQSISLDMFAPEKIVFHIKFEVENLYQDKIDQLKTELEKYNGLNEEQFAAVEQEWQTVYDEMKKYDVFIYNGDYAYIYELGNDENLNKVLACLNNPEYKAHASRGIEVHTLQREMSRIKNMSYEQLLVYWDIYDECNDISYNNVPDAQELERRKKRRETSEQEYNASNEKMRKMMDEFLEKKKAKA